MYTGFLAFSILVSFISILCLRAKLRKDVVEIDAKAYTPSDFCVMGHCKTFKDDCQYTKESIEEHVRANFQKKYQIDDIEYVNVSYRIDNIYALLDK